MKVDTNDWLLLESFMITILKMNRRCTDFVFDVFLFWLRTWVLDELNPKKRNPFSPYLFWVKRSWYKRELITLRHQMSKGLSYPKLSRGNPINIWQRFKSNTNKKTKYFKMAKERCDFQSYLKCIPARLHSKDMLKALYCDFYQHWNSSFWLLRLIFEL